MTQDEIIAMAKEAGWICAEAAPDGWQLVPVEPTDAMLEAMEESGWTEGNYRAMLAAAPKP